MAETLRDQVAKLIAEGVGEDWCSESIADAVLRIPAIYDARKLPDVWPDENDYGRGWNDCRRHARHIV